MSKVYEDAVRAAQYGPEVKQLLVHDHEFNVKPVERKWTGEKLIVRGQISHCIDLVTDDQVYYTIIVDNHRVIDIVKKIENGNTVKRLFGLGCAAGVIVLGILYPPGAPVLAGAAPALNEAVEAANNAVIGNWQQAADTLIAVIAAAMTTEKRPKSVPPVDPDPEGRKHIFGGCWCHQHHDHGSKLPDVR
jgi:hypothetical protein